VPPCEQCGEACYKYRSPLIALAMRDWPMFMLSASYETPDGRDLFIGGETENGDGKTDIFVRYRDRNAFIGECKIWSGESRFSDAIDQLLSYTVPRGRIRTVPWLPSRSSQRPHGGPASVNRRASGPGTGIPRTP